MTYCAVVPLSLNWTFWYKECNAKDEDWKVNIQKLFEISTGTQFLEAYNVMKLPSALPLGASYYLFKKEIPPLWEERPNKGSGAWVILIANQIENDLNLIWSELLFMLISDGFKELSMYLCGIACNVRKNVHKIKIWTVKTSERNHEYIMEIGKVIANVVQNVYKIKLICYKLHEKSSNEFNYVLKF